MKNRNSFVSNSSSTSFIIVCDEKPNIKNITMVEIPQQARQSIKEFLKTQDNYLLDDGKKLYLTEYLDGCSELREWILFPYCDGTVGFDPYEDDGMIDLGDNCWLMEEHYTGIKPLVHRIRELEKYVKNDGLELYSTIVAEIERQNR